MIREHVANSTWWGAPVGITHDASWLELGPGERERLLDPYAWVELRCALNEAPSPALLAAGGFFWIDTQVEFRIALKGRTAAVPAERSVDALSAVFADEAPFRRSFDDAASFTCERYLALPGVDQATLDARFHAWATSLKGAHPAHALELRRGDDVEGWFLAEPRAGASDTVALTLAMATKSSTSSGLVLYERALRAFASRGARLGSARFSVRNTPVLNVYAALGARFTKTIGCWARLGRSYAPPGPPRGRPS